MSEKKEEPFVVVAPIIEADVPTMNGHVYAREVLEKMIADAQEKMRGRVLMGSLSPMTPRRLEDISHLVTDMKLKDKTVEATIEVLDTPRGRMLKTMLEPLKFEKMPEDFPLHFGPAGYGNLVKRPDGTHEVTDFKLASIDVVPNPPWEPKK